MTNGLTFVKQPVVINGPFFLLDGSPEPVHIPGTFEFPSDDWFLQEMLAQGWVSYRSRNTFATVSDIKAGATALVFDLGNNTLGRFADYIRSCGKGRYGSRTWMLLKPSRCEGSTLQFNLEFFEYYDDELRFNASDILGRTSSELSDLFHARYVAYLQS